MAGGAGSTEDEDGITGINVTPLVDIMLVLLIIFMVTATFVSSKALDLKLPEAESSQAMKPEDKPLNFALDKEGQLHLEGKAITFEELGTKIAEEKSKRPGANISAALHADAGTPYALVIKVIDLIRKHEIVDFALATDPLPPATDSST